jgi:hypothetical protein
MLAMHDKAGDRSKRMGGFDHSSDSLPYAQACRRVDFDIVEIRRATHPAAGCMLFVSEVNSWAGLCVALESVPYTDLPEFRLIEVVGRLSGCSLAALVEFCVALPSESMQGSKGIEIVGATKSEPRVLTSDPDTASAARSP